jgi:hypothetical protein
MGVGQWWNNDYQGKHEALPLHLPQVMKSNRLTNPTNAIFGGQEGNRKEERKRESVYISDFRTL